MTEPGLLVSVRSAAEARAAVQGGATVIDVKEPRNGPLGMADPAVWQEARAVVPPHIPVSVALGELSDRSQLDGIAFDGVSFRKIGLANSGERWVDDWRDLRDHLGPGPSWIAVVYLDWREARAPHPTAILAEAANIGCAGVLIDTWGKHAPAPQLDLSWRDRIQRVRETVGLVALAGGLNALRIAELRPLTPDLFAVRGAACERGDRLNAIEVERVKDLRRACVNPVSAPQHGPHPISG